MLIAQGMERYMTGFSQPGGAEPFRSAMSTFHPIKMFRRRYPFRTTISQKRIDRGVG
jgi:hypothetical protein